MRKLIFLIWLLFITSPVYSATDYTTDPNCMGAWYMNVNNGTETDVSGEGENLSQVSGNIPTSATVPSGYDGTSRDFEGGDTEHLQAADGGSTDISGVNQDISICLWIRPESISGTDALIAKWRTSTTNAQYILETVATGGGAKARFQLSSDGSTGTGIADTADDVITIGTWAHICGVYNDTDIRIYIDGSVSGTPTVYSDGIIDKAAPFRVGALGDAGFTGNYFDGLIDEPNIYDRELLAAEVTEIYTYAIDGRLDTEIILNKTILRNINGGINKVNIR